jgi:Glycosyltransferase family 87
LIVLFTGELIVRGPLRFLSQGSEINDFLPPLVQSRIFVSGEDPYNPLELIRFWPEDTQVPVFLRRDVQQGIAVSRDGVPSPYPPTCFALLSPISALPWHLVKLLCLAANCSCAFISIGVLLSLSRLRATSSRAHLFVALALGFAPLHTALASGNLILPVSAAGVGAIWCANRKYATVAGLLLAIATCLKPPVRVTHVDWPRELGRIIFSEYP